MAEAVNSQQALKNKPINIDFSGVYTDDEKEIEITKKEFLSYCPTFDVKDAIQLPLWRILTVGRLNNVSILQLLYSCYMRDRINCFINNQNGIDYEDFVNESPTIKRILMSHNKNLHNNIKSDIIESLKLFFSRRCHRIHLPPLDFINDDINQYAEIIIETIKFIHQSLNKKGNHSIVSKIPPFQIDLWIIPNDINTINDISDDEDDDTDDEEDEDDDDDISDTDADESKISHADLGNIEQRLKTRMGSHNRAFLQDDFSVGKNGISRAFDRKFGLMIEGRQKATNNNDELVYPHKERVCVIIDRRNIFKKNKKDKKDKQNDNYDIKQPLYIFKPNEYSELPSTSHFMNEWCIEATCSHILPSLDINNKSEIINGQNSCKGFMFLLSFQIQEAKIQRCWLYHRSQIHRFFTNDILNVLPMLFKKGKNELSDDLKEQIKNGIDNGMLKLNDCEFDEFYIPIDLKKNKRHANDAP